MMGPAQFITLLRKGQPGPAYFFRGPDRFLHEECRGAIVVALSPEAREWFLAEIEFQPGRLGRELEGASQMPMLGGHSFFVFSDSDDFKRVTDEDYEALEAYLTTPRPSPRSSLWPSSPTVAGDSSSCWRRRPRSWENWRNRLVAAFGAEGAPQRVVTRAGRTYRMNTRRIGKRTKAR